jgi:hypothetical protein
VRCDKSDRCDKYVCVQIALKNVIVVAEGSIGFGATDWIVYALDSVNCADPLVDPQSLCGKATLLVNRGELLT